MEVELSPNTKGRFPIKKAFYLGKAIETAQLLKKNTIQNILI
jgi:hypothetical protein